MLLPCFFHASSMCTYFLFLLILLLLLLLLILLLLLPSPPDSTALFGRTPFFDAICFLFTTPTLSFTIYASICSVIEISARILIVLVDLLHSAAMFVHVQWEMLLFNELFNGRGFVKNDDHTHTPGEAKTNRSDRSMCTYLSRVTDWSLRCRIRQMWG
jgi:hypothetical protein